MEKNKGEKGEVSRRDFLIGSGAVVVGGAIGAGITYPLVAGKDGEVSTVTKTVSVPTTVTKTVGAETVTTTKTVGAETVTSTVPGPTKTVTTTVADGGVAWPYLEPEETVYEGVVCAVAVDTKNGKIVRVRPVPYTEKYPDKKPWSITARGKTFTAPGKSAPSALWTSYKKRVYSANRILYPLQRVDFDPNADPETGRNTQNRGISKYKRISWDEATDIIASELIRVAETYGTEAINNTHPKAHGERNNVSGDHDVVKAFLQYWLFSRYGTGITEEQKECTSAAGGQVGGVFVMGTSAEPGIVHHDVAANTELLVGWGCNGVTCHWADDGDGLTVGNWFTWLKELGIKQVYISPDLNYTAGFYADKWIPVLPLTDGALQLAIAYTWIKEDNYEKDYVANHSVGFDKFEAYVMGDEDGVPKTPQWASPLCGVPVWTIKALAREMVSKISSIMFGRSGGGMCRAPYSSELTRLVWYLLAMQGWGAPGRHLYHGMEGRHRAMSANRPRSVSGVRASSIMTGLMTENLGIKLSSRDTDRQFTPQALLDEAILNPPVEYWLHNDPYTRRTYPMEGFPEIHMIWGTSSSWTGGHGGGFGKLEAFRSPKIECVVNQSLWLEDGMVYSDIILPICGQFELWDIDTTEYSDSFGTLYLMPPAVEPIGETKTDFEAVLEVGKKVGFHDEITGGKSYKEAVEGWIREGYEISEVADFVSWEELNEKGFYCDEIDPAWTEKPTSAAEFYEDPVANPLRSPSGLLEFESQGLLENFPDDKERPPVAHYVRGGPPEEGWTHDESLDSERAKNYPLLVVCSIKTWGEHSEHSDIVWTREIEKIIGWDGYAYSPIWVHPVDAAARGIEHGDIVMMYNERGIVLGGARVCEKIIPGSISMDQGGGGDNIACGEINRGGNPNAICPSKPISKHAHGIACHGFLAELEKVTGNQMDEWRKNYPEAFARPYDPGYGPYFSGWIEGGM